jgi:hypothetical protein
MDEVKVMQVIYCTKKRRGSGRDETSPVRAIREILTTDGELLAERDPCGGYTREELISFALDFKSGRLGEDILQAYKDWQTCSK